MVDPRLAAFKNLPHVGPANIESGTGRLLNNIRTVNEDGLISGKFVFKSGDVIYSKIRPNLRKFAWPKFGGLASADTYVLNSINLDILTQGFIFCTVQTSNFFRYSVSVSMRTGMPKINREDLGLYYFFVPSKSEQNQIAIFWTLLDNILALHERKLALLKKLKTAYLQQLFPENGNTTPRLRFAGFADDWEQRKLGELGDILRKSIDPQLTPSCEFIEYSMPSYDQGRGPNRVLGVSMQSTRLKISGTVLLINKLNVRQRRIWLVENAPENAVASGEFVPFQSLETDLSFLHQLFLSDKTTSKLQSISSGTSNSQKRVTPSDLLHYPIFVPTTKGEQIAVGRLLSTIDDIIALHQRVIDKLQQLKQAYLQKLFV